MAMLIVCIVSEKANVAVIHAGLSLRISRPAGLVAPWTHQLATAVKEHEIGQRSDQAAEHSFAIAPEQ